MKPSGKDLDPVDWVGGKVERALLEAVILTLWRLLAAVGGPVRRFFGFFLWCGFSARRIAVGLIRLARRTVRWLLVSYDLSWMGMWCPRSLRRYHFAFASMVVMGIISTIVKKIRERFDAYTRKRNEILDRMSTAACYSDWSSSFAELRHLDRQNGQRKSPAQESRLYTRSLFMDKTKVLKQVFEKMEGQSDVGEVVRHLREDLVRRMGNMQDSYIYEYFGEIPGPIRDYVEEVTRQIKYISDTPNYPIPKKLSFLQETRHAFGRTALLLSGGGALGGFHLGVVKALLDNNKLPRVVGGSSVGSIVSAIVGTHTESELRKLFGNLEEMDVSFFSNSTLRQILAHLLVKGHLQDEAYLIARLKGLLGELTFLEAYEKSGRVLNVVVCAADMNEPPRVLNYLTAPGVLIWSAVAASSAFPGLFPAQGIISKNGQGDEVLFSAHASHGAERRWRDGSLEEDLPLQTLRELFNVNYFLVSQTNPHIVPMLNFKNKFERRIANAIESEWKHRCQQLQWLLPDWIPSKWLTLFSQNWEGDVTMVLPTGSYWTLRKAIVNPTQKELLDAAHAGEVATWRQLPAIQCNYEIERTLDSCLAQVVGTLKKRKGDGIRTTLKNRIPSWLHMPVLGMPNVESLESLLDCDESSTSTLDPASNAEAPGTPLQSSDYKTIMETTFGDGFVDCLDDTAWDLETATQLLLETSGGNQGLDVIAP